MSGQAVTVVRLYLTEAEHLMERILGYLHDEAGVRGVTVFRGIAGYGRSGTVHSASLVDLSLNLPIVVEFFDDPGRVTDVLEGLTRLVDPEHIITWPAQLAGED